MDFSSPYSMDLRRRDAACVNILMRIAAIRDEVKKAGLPLPGPEILTDDSFVDKLASDVAVAAELFLKQVETEVHRNKQFLETTLRQLARQVEYENVLRLAIQVTTVAGGVLPGASAHDARFGGRGRFGRGEDARGGGGALSFLFGGSRARAAGAESSARAPLLGSSHDTDEEEESSQDMIPLVPFGKSLRKYQSLAESSAVPPILESQSSVPFDIDAARLDANSTRPTNGQSVSMASLWGVIPESHRNVLTRLVTRLARNNAMISWYDLPGKVVDPETLEPVTKSAFSIVLPPSPQLDARVRKVVVSLGANLYVVPPGYTAEQLDALIERSVNDRATRDETVAATTTALHLALMNATWGMSRSERAATSAVLPSHIAANGTNNNANNDIPGVLVSDWDLVSSPLANWTHAIESERSVIRAQSMAYVDATPDRVASTITIRGWVPTHLLGGLRECLADLGTRVGSVDIPKPVIEVIKPIRQEDQDTPSSMLDQPHMFNSQEVPHSNGYDANLVAQPRAVDGTVLKPPTRFESNQVADVFQLVVDTYGVPAYKEANPGYFTIATFPFLFGVMYGDIFHGTFLAIVGLYLLWNAKAHAEAIRLGRASLLASMHPARYLLFFMGLAALYCGLIYNDCASLPLDLFGSPILKEKEALIEEGAPPGTQIAPTQVYPFGFDPGWYHTDFELAFFNSFKMKLSIILGVAHMSFGIILGATNHSFRKHWSSIFLETIPRLVFLWGIFGYMVFIIFVKYATDWSDPEALMITVYDHVKGHYVDIERRPPSLIQTMIQMFLNPGVVEPEFQLYPGQATVQQILLFVSVLTIPVLFIGEPLYRRFIHQKYKSAKKAAAQHQQALSQASALPSPPVVRRAVSFLDAQAPVPPEEAGDPYLLHAPSGRFEGARSTRASARQQRKTESAAGHANLALSPNSVDSADFSAESSLRIEGYDSEGASEDEFGAEAADHLNPRSSHYSFSDDLIHQSIHAIEFVLGAVSNTASYLRLWALSLAHAQLAQVFWNKILVEYGIAVGPVATVIAFGAWAGATFAVLCCMDVIECFLHALRLHWVEFQNKFYSASGHPFVPFVLTDKAKSV